MNSITARTKRNYSSTDSYYIPPGLMTATHVFVRNETKRLLDLAYKGPYKVIKRYERVFTLKTDRGQGNIHIYRLKPAHTEEEILKSSELALIPPVHVNIPSQTDPIPNVRADARTQTRTSRIPLALPTTPRSGRVVRLSLIHI